MKILITYIGRRYSNGKIFFAFRKPDGKEILYKKHKHGRIGKLYEAEVGSKGELLKPDSGPSIEPQEVDANQIEIWEAQDQAAAQRARDKRAAYTEEKHPALFAAVDRIVAKLDGKLTLEERQALARACARRFF